ncbi:glycosyltransferase [Robertmurraya sp. GLU-23]
MKKKLLFVIPSLSAGGGEKSLINLLNQIDYSQYNVDLLLLNQTGTFIKLLPKEVRLISLGNDYSIFTKSIVSSIFGLIKNKKVRLAYNRFMFSFYLKVIKNRAVAEQYTWKYLKNSFNFVENNYDTAIGFLEKTSIYFVVDKVSSKKKIGWVHTNYSNSGLNAKLDFPYFSQLDSIVTVSEECVISLKESFSDLGNKVELVYNILSPELIKELATKDLDRDLVRENGFTTIVTIARLSQEKGIDLAIESCRVLKDKGYKVRWFVLGEGKERKNLESLIKKNRLQDSFFLLGIKENPYPYIHQADVYVQPSRYEGKSIAIDEAKILKKPIVITNFETAKDQIISEYNGLIVETSKENIAKGIAELIHNEELRNKLIENLDSEKLGTVQEIEKVYDLV